MLKKGLIVGAGALLLGLLFFGTSLVSYVTTGVGMVRESVQGSVPLDFELERAKQLIKQLEPEIRSHERQIAREEVEVKALQQGVEAREADLATAERHIKRLAGDLEKGDSYYVYDSKSFTSAQVESDLANRFEKFKKAEAVTVNKRKILNARTERLENTRAKLIEMRNAKSQLELEVAELESRLEALKLAQIGNETNIDDTSLSNTRKMINEIKTRIEVEEQVANQDANITGEIPLDEDEAASTDLLDDVTNYFGSSDESEVAELKIAN